MADQPELGPDADGGERLTDDDLSQLVIGDAAGKKQLEEIRASCRSGERPAFIIGAGTAGSLAAFSDRCTIVKKGGLTSFMAGATGGGRTTTFQYIDITAIEYNSGWLTGVLEILTPSHDAGRAKDYWHMGDVSGGNQDAWQLANTLPLRKAAYNQVRPHIEWMREMIAYVKQPPAQGPAAGPDLSAQLAQLNELHEQGALDDEEFRAAKKRVLGEASGS